MLISTLFHNEKYTNLQHANHDNLVPIYSKHSAQSIELNNDIQLVDKKYIKFRVQNLQKLISKGCTNNNSPQQTICVWLIQETKHFWILTLVIDHTEHKLWYMALDTRKKLLAMI